MKETIIMTESQNDCRTSFQDLTDIAYTGISITEAQKITESDFLRVENQTRIFASMCPDEILDYYNNYETRSYNTTLMMGDVSGFTELTEKYTKSGKGGPSKLTEILNSYIGAMVQEILSHNGDVLKFSGDAFIVMWKSENGRVMRDIASEAIKTACIIQKHFGTYETEVDVVLKVKLAISAGKTHFTSIGDPEITSYYIITGKPVWEVKFAEGLCRGGDILVASSCWQWINPNEYIYELLPDGIHTLIISLSVLWDTTKDTYSVESNSSNSDINRSNVSTESFDSNGSSKTSLFYRTSRDEREFRANPSGYCLRPKVMKVARAKLVDELRSYILRPVIRSVEMDEPLEYLTEIRQVVIVFVNVITEETNRKTLIKLVNSAFQFVCSVVNDMQGCVNKTSLFDKDLIFLCIFGLRGDKHELESQIGLRCASKLRRGLIKFQNVKSVTVGVTTGTTYCGVVGHVLRREYTVIGMAVNKAARLMCAYVNKVVCDRESFLLSHLEAKHFVLQESKYLKGITNVGPIYEFSEQTTSYDLDLKVNKYPLLDRDTEVKIFRNLLDSMFDKTELKGSEYEDDKLNILIIRGEPRIGKTRLLEEMTNVTPENIQINFISLAPNDKQTPYTLLRLLFNGPLDITEDSIPKEKEDKLALHFQEKNDLLELCIFNHVFNVNFKLTRDYERLDEAEREKILTKMLVKLTRSCLKYFWLVLIDDAELADDESITFFHTVAKQKNVLFVLAYGNKLSKDYNVPEEILQNGKIIDLLGLDKWHHAALACQVMDVIAIPAELEKVLQERSFGNPGWIESYLISLRQSKGIIMKIMTKRQIYDIGLVAPPINLLKRLSDWNLDTSSVSSTDGKWEMYQSSFRQSMTESDEDFNDVTPYNVCTLSSKFILEDIDTEATMDAILLKLYDSLTPLDQFLLKCAAILGEIVDRKMLEKLMYGTSERDIALCNERFYYEIRISFETLVKLFELRIIGCAVGDFSRSPGPAMLFKRIHDPNLILQVRCGCKGLEISESLSDLPAYASCGLMRFKLDMFRKTTYKLLTENQKVEFHSKALRYLQQNTRRCTSCGGGPFNRLLGESIFNQFVRKKPLYSITTVLRTSTVAGSEDNEDDVDSTNFERSLKSSSSSSSLSLYRVICQPLKKSPTQTFSNLDFTNCECNLHLLTAYTHIMAHCRGIGVKELLLVAILEFIEVCLSTLNIPQATKLLAEGDELIDMIYTSEEDELILLPYLKGKIQTLWGRCFLESGLMIEAMKCFKATEKIMGYKFPTNRLMIRFKSIYLLKRLHLMLTYMRNFKVGVLDGDAANYNDQFASCLAQMFIVYRRKGMQEHARLAAIWGLNLALESSKDFFVLCTSYANMLIIAHNYQYTSIIPYLETDAINLCHERDDSIELQELNAIAELYTRIFFSRWLRGIIEGAESIGFIANRLAQAILSIHLRLIILPRLIQLLIMECRYGEVASMLQELEFISPNDMDQSGRTWYYSLCMDLLLEFGISLVPLRECEQFYQRESSKIMNLRDSEASKRFFVCMWYVRSGDWEIAAVWKSRKCDKKIPGEYSVAAAMTILKRIEGFIIYYVYKIDSKNVEDASLVLQHIKKSFRIMKDMLKVVKIVYPRYLLMKAYYNMTRSRKKTGLALLEKSKREANLIGNQMIYTWADHCEKAWTGTLSIIEQDFWREQCAADIQVAWHEIEIQNRKIIPYTLPLPKNQV